MSAIISLKHVEHWYDRGKQNEVHALKDINLDIEQGDYVAFFGPSGCGKTTLLYATSGIDRVTSGEIFDSMPLRARRKLLAMATTASS